MAAPIKTAVIRLRIARALEAAKASGLARSGRGDRGSDPAHRRRLAALFARTLDLYWPGATRPD